MGKLGAIINRVRHSFSSGQSYQGSGGISEAKEITTDLAKFLIDLTDFQNEIPEVLYEDLYKWEPEIGGAIDKISTMVGQSYKYFTTRPSTFYPEDVKGKEDLTDEMVKQANSIAEEIDVRNAFEIYMEVLLMHGNLYLENHPDFRQTIIPNKQVALLDSLDHRYSIADPTFAMTEANVMIINEGTTSERVLENSKNKKSFVIQRFKDTPIFVRDNKGRNTFGIYAISPLQRAVIPIWQKRQISIIDILWRWRNVPREHHKLKAEMFSLDKYTGDPRTRLQASRTDATTYLNDYVNMVKNQMPDQGMVTLDTAEVSYIQPQNSQYMEGNALLDQINDQVWSALNVPKSIVTGQSKNSYASELIISNYTATKVIQLATKVKKVILNNMRDRLLFINSNFPVDILDIKIEFVMANSMLETYRQMAILASVDDTFTRSEMRELVQKPPITKEQEDDLYSASRIKMQQQVSNINNPMNNPSQDESSNDPSKLGKNKMQQQIGNVSSYPSTGQNDTGTDRGKYAYEKTEQPNM